MSRRASGRVRQVTGAISAGKELRKQKVRVDRAGERLHKKRNPSTGQLAHGSPSHRPVETEPLSSLGSPIDKRKPYSSSKGLIRDLAALAPIGALDPKIREVSLDRLNAADRAGAFAVLERLDALDAGIRSGTLPAEASWPVFICGTALRVPVVLDIVFGRAKPGQLPIAECVFTRPRR